MRCWLEQTTGFPLPAAPDSCGLDFWYSPAALRWLGGFLGARPALLGIEEGGRRALLRLLLRPLPGGFRLASAYPYGVIEGDPALFWRTPDLGPTLRRAGVVRLEVPFTGPGSGQIPDPLPVAAPFRWPPALDAVRHLLDLRAGGGDEGWLDRTLGRKIRWAVGRARRNGCEVRPARAEEMGAVQAIYAATMRAKGAPVNYGAARFSGILEHLRPAGLGEVFLGTVRGEPAGMAAMVGGESSRHLVQVAVLPEHQPSRLGELLVHTAIRQTLTIGLGWFDFMASPVHDTGLIAFKAKWATVPEPIRHAVLDARPLLSAGIDLARRLNRARGRLRAR